MQLKIKKTHPQAQMPTYATDGAACFDIRALERGEVPPQDAVIFATGLSVEVPEGWALMLYSRSGHGFNHDIRLANCVGIIDSDYRGEIKVKLTNDNHFKYLSVAAGDRICQELTDTERGTGGFGSTGK